MLFVFDELLKNLFFTGLCHSVPENKWTISSWDVEEDGLGEWRDWWGIFATVSAEEDLGKQVWKNIQNIFDNLS